MIRSVLGVGVTRRRYGPGMSESLPSLELIADELRRDRENHLRHLDAFETKAGILLGSSGALAAAALLDLAVILTALRTIVD